MKKNPIVIVIIALLVVVFLIWIIMMKKSSNPNNVYVAPTSQNVNNNVVSNNSAQLFADSPLAQSSYLISTSTYDANTKKALNGFTITKTTLSDGSMQIVLDTKNPEYKTQTYVVKPGEKLFFIERNLVDDATPGTSDKILGDDSAVLVDANGYIVQQ